MTIYYGVHKDKNGIENANLYYGNEGLQLFHSKTFTPDSFVYLLSLGNIKGRNYKEKKQAARDLAIEYSNNIYGGLSYGECAEISNFFEKIGKRYGLLEEFRENCII